MHGALVLAEGMVGMMEASAMRMRFSPFTFPKQNNEHKKIRQIDLGSSVENDTS